jgi:predicted nucleic acid-binding protein
MIILDSNIWIAYLNKSDSQHRKAVSLFGQIKDEILITEYIIIEVATVLAMRVDKNIADDFIRFVTDNTDIQVLSSSENFLSKSIEYFFEYKDNDLSFVDISLLALSKNYELYTFDKELKKQIV